MVKVKEQYKINFADKVYTLKLYADGYLGCSCKNKFGDCLHVRAFRNQKATVIEMRRF